MNTWCQEVKTSIEKNQPWIPSIPMSSSVWSPSNILSENDSQTNNNHTETVTDETTLVDPDILMDNSNTPNTNVIDIIFSVHSLQQNKSNIK
jgi:hypothetical protein